MFFIAELVLSGIIILVHLKYRTRTLRKQLALVKRAFLFLERFSRGVP